MQLPYQQRQNEKKLTPKEREKEKKKLTSQSEAETHNLLPGRLSSYPLYHWDSSNQVHSFVTFVVRNYYSLYLKAENENQESVQSKFLIWSTLHADILWNPSPGSNNYITLHYITLHYITLHYITHRESLLS